MKTFALISLSGLLMGNQSCEKEAPIEPSGRTLKKVVEMGSIRSPKMTLPGGGVFDFQFVANQQIFGVMTENQNFAVKYNPIIIDPVTSGSGDGKYFNVSKLDQKLLLSLGTTSSPESVRLTLSRASWCMANLPQFKFAGSVNSYEIVGGGGISIGFTPGGSHDVSNVGLGFQAEKAQMDLSLQALHPLTNLNGQVKKTIIAGVNVTQDQTSSKISAGIQWGLLSIGGNYYYQTPLATVTKMGLTKAVNKMSTALTKEEWYTRVIYNEDKYLIISGGRDLGIEDGDEMYIYNEENFWMGAPCNSELRGSFINRQAAVAKVIVESVGDEISKVRVVEQSSQLPEIGAKVILSQFHTLDYKSPDAKVGQ